MPVVVALVFPCVAFAGGGAGTFEFTAVGGSIANPDPGSGGIAISFFPLTFDDAGLEIADLELEITDLSHTMPADLNIFLLDPFGNGLEIMDDRGDGFAISNISLIFNDLAVNVLPTASEIMAGTFVHEGPLSPGGADSFAQFTAGGTNAWILVVADDNPGNEGPGSFGSYTLRGTIVPEPVTLSLLALGAAAGLRRRRR